MSTHDNIPQHVDDKHIAHHHHSSAGEDRAEGGMKQMKGRLKESAGALTGNEELRQQGREDQVHGKAKEKKGKVKENIKNFIDRA